MEAGRDPAQTTIGVDHITGKSQPPGRDQTTRRKLHIGCPTGKAGLGASPRPDDYSILAAICQYVILHKKKICAICTNLNQSNAVRQIHRS